MSGSSPQRLWTPGPWVCGETALTVDIPNRVQEHCQTNSKSFRIVGTFKAVASHTPDAIDSSVSREYRQAQPPTDPVGPAGPLLRFRAHALMRCVACLPPGYAADPELGVSPDVGLRTAIFRCSDQHSGRWALHWKSPARPAPWRETSRLVSAPPNGAPNATLHPNWSRWSRAAMKTTTSLYYRHRFPGAIISCTVRGHFRFQLSLQRKQLGERLAACHRFTELTQNPSGL